VPGDGPTADVKDDLAPTGTLRASINLGNPVLAQGDGDDPRGVTVDLARDLARRLDLPLALRCFGAARDSYAATCSGEADVCFLAVEPAREAGVVSPPRTP
jgi:polar amino acid transport system substrate-binding protein